MSSAPALTRDSGSGSIVTVALVCVIVIIGVALVSALAVFAVKSKVQAVADGAALSFGREAALSRWEGVRQNACDSATEYVEREGMKVLSCRVEGGDIWLEVSRSIEGMGMSFDVRARARAGPE